MARALIASGVITSLKSGFIEAPRLSCVRPCNTATWAMSNLTSPVRGWFGIGRRATSEVPRARSVYKLRRLPLSGFVAGRFEPGLGQLQRQFLRQFRRRVLGKPLEVFEGQVAAALVAQFLNKTHIVLDGRLLGGGRGGGEDRTAEQEKKSTFHG